MLRSVGLFFRVFWKSWWYFFEKKMLFLVWFYRLVRVVCLLVRRRLRKRRHCRHDDLDFNYTSNSNNDIVSHFW